MKNKIIRILKKGLLGMLIGEFITTLIPIIISLSVGDGNYYPVVPEFLETCKTEIGAVVLQFVLGGILGTGIGLGTLVWESERLSPALQTLIHFAVLVLCMFPIAWICHWMPHTVGGVVNYAAIFLTIYLIVWLAIYIVESVKVKKMNARLVK